MAKLKKLTSKKSNKNQAQIGIYLAYFLEVLSGSSYFINSADSVVSIIRVTVAEFLASILNSASFHFFSAFFKVCALRCKDVIYLD